MRYGIDGIIIPQSLCGDDDENADGKEELFVSDYFFWAGVKDARNKVAAENLVY